MPPLTLTFPFPPFDDRDERLVGRAVGLHPETLDAGAAESEFGAGDCGVAQRTRRRPGERL